MAQNISWYGMIAPEESQFRVVNVKPVTLYDVAEYAGVSYQTVSRVVNQASHVSAKTREKVEAAMAQLNYIPNRVAQQLAGKQSLLIGVATSSLALHAPSQIVAAIKSRADQLGASVVVSMVERSGVDDIDGDGATCATDCDDDAEAVHPGADEVCNQTDDDCDQGIDEAVNTDEDPALCIDDCDDFDETIYPGAYDGCDGDALGRSDDCDEPIDEGDLDNDGVACRDDCDDEDEHRFPGNPEVCDTHVDEDCDPLTEPAPQPCFEYADVNTCFYGFRSCDSSTGTYRDACVSEAETPLPLGVCEGFADCADADDNRLACGADVLHDCDQLLTPDGGLCPEPAFPLDAGAGMTPCTWQLIGGPVQQGWTVGLVPAGGGPPGALVTTCQASFRVIEPPVTGSEGSFGVALSVGGVHQRTEVFVIAPKAEAVCAAPSLVCLTATMP